MIQPFKFASMPGIIFGPGKINALAKEARYYGKNALVLTGKTFLTGSGIFDRIKRQMEENGLVVFTEQISTEPTPTMIDMISGLYRSKNIDVVISIGGGSVMDAGKAISAMIPLNEPVKTFLEGVGSKNAPGIKIPFIAVPTTAGTGSETTKNAVISEIGEKGYKKSLRHDNYVPDIALVDPELTLDCPADISAAGGMDALTQLVEAFMSPTCDQLTSSLVLPAIGAVGKSLVLACTHGNQLDARTDMSYAAMISGIALANAGLGIVHGFASPLGGKFPIPHGVVCGTLMAASFKYNYQKLRQHNDTLNLNKFKLISQSFFNNTINHNNQTELFIEKLYDLTTHLNLPKLGEFGITLSHLSEIAEASDNKNNPVKLNNTEKLNILTERL